MTDITEKIISLEAAAKEAYDYTNMPMEVDPRDILELTTHIRALQAEIEALREALVQIDAIDPEGYAAGFSVDALRILIARMGAIARAALAAPYCPGGMPDDD